MPGGDAPAIGVAGRSVVGRVARSFEAVGVEIGQFGLMSAMAARGQHDFRRERQRRHQRHQRPQGKGAIVGPIRHTARHVVEELPIDDLDLATTGS